MKIKNILLIFILIIISVKAQESSQTFLELKNTGVEEFIKQHPEYDGRGTIILVLDTGVDVGVEGLLKTLTGETKIIDVQDFSTQGDFDYYDADVDRNDGLLIFSNSEKGFSVKSSENNLLKTANGKYYIGALPEKYFLNSTSGAKDFHGNNTPEDICYFIVFNASEDGENFWVV